jgi:hypothetical protein
LNVTPIRVRLALPTFLTLAGLGLGCAGESADVRARFLSTHAECREAPQVVHREEATPIAEDAPDRDKLRNLLAGAKPGHDYYDVHGCGAGAVFECSDQMDYREDGSSRRARHCGAIASWGATSAAAAAAATGVVFEATDGSSRNAPGEETTSIANKTAIASAAHDLPCDPASIQVVGNDASGRANAAEGCGLRATYDILPFTPDDPVRTGAASGLRYKLTARASVGGGPQPSAVTPSK